MALLNRSPTAETVSLSFADDLGLPAGSQWAVVDAWTEGELVAASDMIDTRARATRVNVARRVPAHGVEIMVLSPKA